MTSFAVFLNSTFLYSLFLLHHHSALASAYLSSRFIHVLSPPTVVICADVRCSACGGRSSARAEPQSGDRSEASELHFLTHLAARHQSHELPAHGTCHHGYPIGSHFLMHLMTLVFGL